MSAPARFCTYCGAAVPPPPPPPASPPAAPPFPPPPAVGAGQAPPAHREAIPEGLPPAPEARRIRGLAVPLVAALVVGGIGLPLTALAVSQVGRLPEVGALAPGPSTEETGPGAPGTGEAGAPESPPAGGGRGQVRLSGALVYDGPATPVGCAAGAPKVVTANAGGGLVSIVLSTPAAAGPGTYPLAMATGTFVAVTRQGAVNQVWTSVLSAAAAGDITIRADRSVSASFRGLQPNAGGAQGTVDGAVEVTCG